MKTTVRLTPPILHELQAQLLRAGSLSAEMTLVEERHSNGDIVVRLAGLPSAEVRRVKSNSVRSASTRSRRFSAATAEAG